LFKLQEAALGQQISKPKIQDEQLANKDGELATKTDEIATQTDEIARKSDNATLILSRSCLKVVDAFRTFPES
jgi:hypothetical protein